MLDKKIWIRLSSMALCSLFVMGIASAQTLIVDMKAPAIKVGKWIKGTEVNEFKAGSVYVVEFWATWCGPCKATIPHLTELQKKYKDKATFIGITGEKDVALIEKFVKDQGDKMDYSVAMDVMEGADAGFMNRKWMAAAAENGIPTSFLVGKDGKLKWIGHPVELESHLKTEIGGATSLKIEDFTNLMLQPTYEFKNSYIGLR